MQKLNESSKKKRFYKSIHIQTCTLVTLQISEPHLLIHIWFLNHDSVATHEKFSAIKRFIDMLNSTWVLAFFS